MQRAPVSGTTALRRLKRLFLNSRDPPASNIPPRNWTKRKSSLAIVNPDAKCVELVHLPDLPPCGTSDSPHCGPAGHLDRGNT